MKTAVLFSGQGAQHVGMGETLYEGVEEVKELWEEADDLLGFDLVKAMLEGPEEALTETRICQPALYVHGYSVFKALEAKGELKDLKAALGLSLGELTALAAAGVFDFETGLRIVSARGTLMQQACEVSEGGMSSLIGGSLEEAEKLAEEFDVDIANLNCPGQIVISGYKSRIEKATEEAANRGFKRAILLKVAGAYHSRLMVPAANAFKAFLEDIEFREPKLTVFSNYTGKAYASANEMKEALVQQVTKSVRWEENMRAAVELGVEGFFECGPGKVLAGLARRTEKAWQVKSVSELSDV